jgi:hypothetical protein
LYALFFLFSILLFTRLFLLKEIFLLLFSRSA